MSVNKISLRVTDRHGLEHEVEAPTGRSLMETLRNLEYGVAASCGGECSCATCHVYAAGDWLDKLPPAAPAERELVRELAHYKPESRLSCQLQVNDALSGLHVTIAPEE